MPSSKWTCPDAAATDGAPPPAPGGHGHQVPAAYQTKPSRRPMPLAYCFAPAIGATANSRKFVARAFAAWAALCPELQFAEVPYPVHAGDWSTIGIVFLVDDLDPNISASASWSGRAVTFDPAAGWTQQGFQNVAMHEIGHALGLLHATSTESVMYPSSDPARTDKPKLSVDDVLGIRALYSWSDARPVGDLRSGDRPGVCATATELVVACRHDDGSSITIATSDDGRTWVPRGRLEGVGTSSGPTIAHDGELFWLAWKGAGNDPTVWHAKTRDFAWWTPQRPVGNAHTSAAPAIAVDPLTRRPVLVCRTVTGSQIAWTAVDDTGDWRPALSIPGVGTSHAPALAAGNTTLTMAWKGVDGDPRIYESSTQPTPFNDTSKLGWGPQADVSWKLPANGGLPYLPRVHAETREGPSVSVADGHTFIGWAQRHGWSTGAFYSERHLAAGNLYPSIPSPPNEPSDEPYFAPQHDQWSGSACAAVPAGAPSLVAFKGRLHAIWSSDGSVEHASMPLP